MDQESRDAPLPSPSCDIRQPRPCRDRMWQHEWGHGPVAGRIASTPPASEAAQPAVAATQSSPGTMPRRSRSRRSTSASSHPCPPCRRPAPTRSSSRTPARPSMTSPSPTARRSAPRAERARPALVTVPAAGLTFMCSIPGHADAGHEGRGHGRGSGSGRDAGAPSPPGRRRRPSPIRTRPSTPSSTPRRPSSSTAPSTTSTSRSSTRTSPSPRASSSRPGRSAARCPGRRCGSTSATRSTST